MKYWHYLFFVDLFCLSITSDLNNVIKYHVQTNERIRLECGLKSKSDTEDTIWMRIRQPYNPDILTYRDTIVYAKNQFELEQRLVSSSNNINDTFTETYYLILTILRTTIDDEGRYVCSKGRHIFAEYDVHIIVLPHFIEENSSPQQQTIVEGTTLHLFCSAEGRPTPSIIWFYRTNDNKLILLGDGTGCQEQVCDIFLGNYTRHDPTVIECIADNEQTNRIAKVFNIDVHYPPRISTNVRTLIGIKSIDVFIECTSIANPSGQISWFDDNQQEITNFYLYTIRQLNSTSILSFTVYSNEHSKVLFYCRSNNSIGTVEKLINISEFIQFDSQPTTTAAAATQLITIHSSNRPTKTKSNRLKFIPSTTMTSNCSLFIVSLKLVFIIFSLHFI